MPRLDAALAEKICEDLARLPEDTKPLWGKMTPPQVRGHLRSVLEYTLGGGAEMPFRGNWKSRHVFRRLIVSGLVPIPHNVKLPRQKDGAEVPIPEATLEELRASLSRYVAAVNGGTARPRMHPFFGLLSASEWQRFHAAHFKHHLAQFGVWS